MIHSFKTLKQLITYKNALVNNIANLKQENQEQNKIQECETQLKPIIEYINTNCQHDVEIDYIDSIKNGDYHTEMIRYCTKCELTL